MFIRYGKLFWKKKTWLVGNKFAGIDGFGTCFIAMMDIKMSLYVLSTIETIKTITENRNQFILFV